MGIIADGGGYGKNDGKPNQGHRSTVKRAVISEERPVKNEVPPIPPVNIKIDNDQSHIWDTDNETFQPNHSNDVIPEFTKPSEYFNNIIDNILLGISETANRDSSSIMTILGIDEDTPMSAYVLSVFNSHKDDRVCTETLKIEIMSRLLSRLSEEISNNS